MYILAILKTELLPRSFLRLCERLPENDTKSSDDDLGHIYSLTDVGLLWTSGKTGEQVEQVVQGVFSFADSKLVVRVKLGRVSVKPFVILLYM